jgi:hypothetical protein
METLLFTGGLLILTVFAVNGVLRVVYESSLFENYRQTLTDIRTARAGSADLVPTTPQEIAAADVVVTPPQGWFRLLGRLPNFVLALLSCEYCFSHWITFAAFGFFVCPAVICHIFEQIGVAYAIGALPAVFGCIELRYLLNTAVLRRFSA